MIENTHTLIGAVKKMYPVVQFFKDRYFPDGKCYYSEKALIETKRRGRKIAPFVIPVSNGIAMESEGYKADLVDAPYIAPKMPITADQLEKKAFGEAPDSGRSPADRENEVEAENLDDLRRSIFIRQEKMCVDLIMYGEIIMKHFATAEDAAKGQNYQTKVLRYYDGSYSPNVIKFTKKISEMTGEEKIQELYKVVGKLRKRGFKATDMVMTADVAMLFLTDKEFVDFYDIRDMKVGDIDQEELPDGVVKNGTINVLGMKLTMYTYDNTFEDLDGEEKEMLPAGTIAFLHPGMGTTAYAQVTFVKGGSFRSYAERIVPRVVASETNNVIEVQAFSRPVPYPHHTDSWLVGNANNEAIIPVGYSLEDGKPVVQISSAAKAVQGADMSESDMEDRDGESMSESDMTDPDGEIELKTTEEIDAMRTKAELIGYGSYIGMEEGSLTTDMSMNDLKNAVLDFQAETYPEDE